MLIDITLSLTPEMMTHSNNNTAKSLIGHLGTHFDVMDKEFPPEYIKRCGIIFGIDRVTDRMPEFVLNAGWRFIDHTYPMSCQGVTGLPCRVIAEV